MKLFWQDVGPQQGPFPARLRQTIADVAKQAARPDTTIEVRGLENMAGPSSLASFRLLNAREILKSMVRADAGGYDALILGCNLDPAIWEAREVLRTPVVASGETSMLWGLSLGDRLGMVTGYDEHVPLLEAMIARDGLRERFLARRPVRGIGLGRDEFMRMFEIQSELVQRIRQRSEALIDDGAEVVVLGCVLLGLLCAREGVAEAAPGVPLVNPAHVAVKHAESLVDLHRAGIMPDFSRRLRYRRPSADDMEALKKALDV